MERPTPAPAGSRTRSDACTFCSIRPGDVLASNDAAVGLRATYPVSPGHALIVPRRHEADFFRLTEEEKIALLRLVEPVRRRVEDEFSPDGYNLGLNAGTAAGQTIMHAHLHVIPRYTGDVEDPRGGVRWILPKAAKYWTDA